MEKSIEMATGHAITNNSLQVWHVSRNTLGYQPIAPKWPADYTHVATLDAADLDDAFRKSNSIDSAWFEADGVSLVNDGDLLRSTSVNDVLRCFSGTAHKVANCGFVKVFNVKLLKQIRKAHWVSGPRDPKHVAFKFDDTVFDAPSTRSWQFTSAWAGGYMESTFTLTACDAKDGATPWEIECDFNDFCAFVDNGLVSYDHEARVYTAKLNVLGAAIARGDKK